MGIRRVYATEENADIEAAVATAVRESAVTCERCGRPGRLRSDPEWRRRRHYLLTLCDPCAIVELAEYKSNTT